jgi:hypothetical protein
MGANRGALPFHKLGGAPQQQRVLVPLGRGEALWVAWFVRPGTEVTGLTEGGKALRVVPLDAGHRGWALLAADAVESSDGLRPIDALTVTLAERPDAVERDHLTFRVTGGARGHLGVVLATPDVYQSISGRPAPEPTSAADAYGGWRLP